MKVSMPMDWPIVSFDWLLDPENRIQDYWKRKREIKTAWMYGELSDDEMISLQNLNVAFKRGWR